MKIIDLLEQKSQNPSDDSVKMELKLYTLANDLKVKAENHLKRIREVLPEFDLHDEKHSEKVLSNIEHLLGETVIQSLSVYELFLLYLSAYFHDCAMAPSEWEINTLKLTEGFDDYCSVDYSIKNDLKPPLKLSEAIEVIKQNKDNLYKDYSKDVSKWLFVSKNEKELIEYLANLLVEYQEYRNGFSNEIKRVQKQEEFDELNSYLHACYIRDTHHKRVETYIKNLEKKNSDKFPQAAWGVQLFNDLANICKSHGENISYIDSLDKQAQYFGADSANLQFIAVMLRLGDIIHFSFDRAPVEIRSARIFESEYSFQQWAVKESGVNYSIEKGQIIFRAYCDTPDNYFKLHQYIDWIDEEIQNYFKFLRQWDKKYNLNLCESVDRVNIKNNEENFLPVRGLSFTLNQNRIIELLMGVNLYKDKYSCLRELYQNSLDACRCMLAQNRNMGVETKGHIEFGISDEDDNRYLYCMDNGIGMSKEIIENYLLKIGNSYYKSADFFKKQAAWRESFTPTSQFGIGLLSCFMLGNRIEITTRVANGECISCSIDGPHEIFYYKKTSVLDKEKLPVSGTIVKVFLNRETKDELINTTFGKLGLVLFGDYDLVTKKYPELKVLFNNEENKNKHLYFFLNEFIGIVPNDINVVVLLDGNVKRKILSKPLIWDVNNKDLEIEMEDFKLISTIERVYEKAGTKDIHAIIDQNSCEHITIEHNGIEFKTIIQLPKRNLISKGFFQCDSDDFFNSIPNGLDLYPQDVYSGILIDGIWVEDNVFLNACYSDTFKAFGLLNFTGEFRPQLSVDRNSITFFSEECDMVVKELAILFIKEIIDRTNKHIKGFDFENDNQMKGLIWEHVLELGEFQDLYIQELSCTKYGNIYFNDLYEKLDKQTTIRDFILGSEIELENYNKLDLNYFSYKVLTYKLLYYSDSISVSRSTVKINMGKQNLSDNRGAEVYEVDYDRYLIRVDLWDNDYDIKTNLLPFIPQNLFDLLGDSAESTGNAFFYNRSSELDMCLRLNPFNIHNLQGIYSGLEERIYGFKKYHNLNFDLIFIENNTIPNKQKYALMLYVAPDELQKSDEEILQKIKESDPSYYKGVKEGWSILLTGMEIDNAVIIAGECKREELVAKLSDKFWEEYKDYTFKFTDNTVLSRL